MKRNRAALVTSVSTAMLGAGWAAGVVGTAMAAQAQGLTTTFDAAGAQTPAADASASPSASVSPSASPGAVSASPSASDPATSAAATTEAPAAAATNAPATSAPATTAAPAPPPAPAGPTGTFQSATVKTRYGNYQVALSVDAGKITKVSMLQSGANDGTSRQITASALPTLQQRVLSAQSYNVQGVSGASYTTQGFKAAVQSAMQAAGI